MNDIAICILLYFVIGVLLKLMFSIINFECLGIEKDLTEIMQKSPLIGLSIPIIFWPIPFLSTCMMILHFWILRILNRIL
jgi:hypothetical protein